MIIVPQIYLGTILVNFLTLISILETDQWATSVGFGVSSDGNTGVTFDLPVQGKDAITSWIYKKSCGQFAVRLDDFHNLFDAGDKYFTTGNMSAFTAGLVSTNNVDVHTINISQPVTNLKAAIIDAGVSLGTPTLNYTCSDARTLTFAAFIEARNAAWRRAFWWG